MIKLFTDGASDLTKEDLERYNITNIPFYILKDGCEKLYSNDELYNEMIENPNQVFKTACPAPQVFYELFKAEAIKGNDIICVCITKEFSASYNSAIIAEKMINEEFSVKTLIIDSRMNTVLQGSFTLEIARMIENKIDIDSIKDKISFLTENGKILFTVEDIHYLKKGGRIGLLKSFLVKSFLIKPIICMEKGNIKSSGFGIGVARTVKKIFEKIERDIKEIGNYIFTVGYSSNKKMGEKLFEDVKKLFNLKDEQISIKQIGITTAVHTGPNTIGVGLLRLK